MRGSLRCKRAGTPAHCPLDAPTPELQDDKVKKVKFHIPLDTSKKLILDLEDKGTGRRQAAAHISVSSDEVLASTENQRQNGWMQPRKKSTV